MQQEPDWIEKRQHSRRQAEQLLAGLSSAEMAVQPAEVLVHELLVHKVELEMQVEELRRAHISTEEARDRYVDLYDHSPVGYITVSREGVMGESNLTSAAMLGVDRNELIGNRFSKFVAPQDTDRWHRLFRSLMASGGTEKQTIVLEMTRADASTVLAYIDCLRRESADTSANLRLTLIDIGKIKQAEAELRDATIPPGGQ